MKSIRTISCLLLFLSISLCLSAQKAAMKTNLLYDATTTANIGIEIGFSSNWTLDVSGNINAWTYSDDKKWKHWLVQPEARYWFCERFNGHFIGLHVLGGEYNIGNVRLPFGVYPATKGNRFEGWGVGGGLSYGYQWILSRHWSIEGAVGLGYIYSKYKKYPCDVCGDLLNEGSKNYFGPTKLALSVIYVF